MMISNRKNNLRILAIFLFLGVMLGACSPEDQIRGVWKEQDGDMHIRFHTGDFISQRVYFDNDTLSLTGTFEIVNDSQMSIEFTEGEWEGLKSGLYEFTISRDILTLNEMTFERQPDVYTLE